MPRRARPVAGWRLCLALATALAWGCDRGEGGAPAAESAAVDASPEGSGAPNAQPELVASLRQARDVSFGPADGGGRAWLHEDSGAAPAVAGRPDRFIFFYAAGPEGVAVGGRVMLQVPPFWGWDPPQLDWQDRPGFTRVTSEAAGVRLRPELADQGLLSVTVEGRPLAPGEWIRFDYGAGPAGARADRFAERGAPFFVWVDGDGDGTRKLIAEPPRVDVVAGPPARLVLHLPAVARPGEAVPLRLALLDREGNAGVRAQGPVTLRWPDGLAGPEELEVSREDAGIAELTVRAQAPGVMRVEALFGEAGAALRAESNPMVVSANTPRVLFGDLHGHSHLSDGTGTPEDYYDYARRVGALDVAALTDHDHWGLPFLDESPSHWKAIQEATEAAHRPGEFVSLLGYEWTSWIHGHRHVLHFEDRAPLHSSLDEATDTPRELWDALRGAPALTFAHHSAGEPVATDWSYPPDPELEPVTEIASVHGSSEARDTPSPVRGGIEGNFVRDALARGYRLGLVGSGDSHDGHPGLAQLASGTGGLAGILAEERSRPAVLAALRARRSYATNGPRIVLDVRLDGEPVGSEVPSGSGVLSVRAAAPAPLEALEIVTERGVVHQLPVEGARELAMQIELEPMPEGSWLYLRLRQRDGGCAWSSPFFFGPSAAPR